MRPGLAMLLGTVLLAALVAAWFFNTFERLPVKERTPPSGEARLRHFLAAERFLERMGLPAKELRSLPELQALPVNGVLIMPNRRQAIDAGRIARLVGWVHAGGHLIVEAEFFGVEDPLLESLGVRRKAREPMVKPIALQVDGKQLSVFFPGAIALEYSGGARLRAGDQLVSFPRGKGMVSAATSFAFARNGLIGANDHADFLWTLVNLTPAAELEVFFRPERLSLWRFLFENAWPALIAAFCLLAAWLWRIAPRFGPVAPEPAPVRRRLLDHLRASGRYFWTQGLRARLVIAARDAALRRIARAQPDFAALSTPERVQRVCALTGMTRQEAMRLVSAAGAMRGADFIRFASNAQRVHHALERGSE